MYIFFLAAPKKAVFTFCFLLEIMYMCKRPTHQDGTWYLYILLSSILRVTEDVDPVDYCKRYV